MTGLSGAEVENCKFAVQCTKTWETLRIIQGEKGMRFCSECAQVVRLCTTAAEVKRHSRERHCIAIEPSRAYGNWQWFARYREVLLHNAVELIQLFPPGASAKNGADIKLCLDATEDIIRFPHITTTVIVGGDSDFLPVAQKIKAAGKMLVGVGCEASTNRHWAHSCHEFRYYEKLLIDDEKAVAVVAEQSDDLQHAPPDAVELIRRAIARLSANRGDPWVLKAAIRPMVKRLDPTFDERNHGVSTFAELLKAHSEIFEVRKGQHDQEYRIKQQVSN